MDNHPPKKLLSDTQVPIMEEGKEYKVVDLKSGKELFDPYTNQKPDTSEEKGSPDIKEENEDGWMEV